MDHIPEDVLADLRDMLEAEKATVEEQLAEHGKPVGDDWQGKSEEEGEEADPGDVATNIEELVTNVPLVEGWERRLKDINAALKKMDDGTYGKDEKTGEAIPLERLEADPAARENIA